MIRWTRDYGWFDTAGILQAEVTEPKKGTIGARLRTMATQDIEWEQKGFKDIGAAKRSVARHINNEGLVAKSDWKQVK